MKLTKSMLLIAAELMSRAADEFSNHGCNDFPEFEKIIPDLEERRAIVKVFHEMNGDPQEYDPNRLHMQDSSLMWMLAKMFEKAAEDAS